MEQWIYDGFTQFATVAQDDYYSFSGPHNSQAKIRVFKIDYHVDGIFFEEQRSGGQARVVFEVVDSQDFLSPRSLVLELSRTDTNNVNFRKNVTIKNLRGLAFFETLIKDCEYYKKRISGPLYEEKSAALRF